jgi:hypothetical protein
MLEAVLEGVVQHGTFLNFLKKSSQKTVEGFKNIRKKHVRVLKMFAKNT